MNSGYSMLQVVGIVVLVIIATKIALLSLQGRGARRYEARRTGTPRPGAQQPGPHREPSVPHQRATRIEAPETPHY